MERLSSAPSLALVLAISFFYHLCYLFFRTYPTLFTLLMSQKVCEPPGNNRCVIITLVLLRYVDFGKHSLQVLEYDHNLGYCRTLTNQLKNCRPVYFLSDLDRSKLPSSLLHIPPSSRFIICVVLSATKVAGTRAPYGGRSHPKGPLARSGSLGIPLCKPPSSRYKDV